MKRRSFLKTVPTLATIPYWPAFTSQEPKKRHLIALGTAASILALKYDTNIRFDTVTIVTDSKPKFAIGKIEYIEFIPPDSVYTFLGDQKYLKKEPFQVIELPEAITNALRSKKGEVVIMASLGKFTGTVLSISIASAFAGYSDLRFVGSIPFGFEGSYNRNQAIKASSEIALYHQCQFYDLESVREEFGNLSIRNAFDKADKKLMERLA